MLLKYRNNLYTAYVNAEPQKPEGYEGKYRGLSTTIHPTQTTVTSPQKQVITYRGITSTVHLA
ncbi:DUF4278 domain-containing protein [Acaryochloris sp. IP29b_bin.148]|uniref:DUF4278 domain-containing protein n=1 Tax=Acaryochloris sp. IP29b_bin.148 TaxID=2969218 RepID=UPI00262A325D|nr:DUF4278 domain-containing protein [Acaryochloris sp. IP29b_bin.148]